MQQHDNITTIHTLPYATMPPKPNIFCPNFNLHHVASSGVIGRIVVTVTGLFRIWLPPPQKKENEYWIPR